MTLTLARVSSIYSSRISIFCLFILLISLKLKMYLKRSSLSVSKEKNSRKIKLGPTMANLYLFSAAVKGGNNNKRYGKYFLLINPGNWYLTSFERCLRIFPYSVSSPNATTTPLPLPLTILLPL